MATLGRKASAVVEAGRGPLRGTDADLERIEAALRARLGTDVLPPETAASAVPRSVWWRALPPAIGVCVIGGALFLALRPAPKPTASQKAGDTRPPVAAAIVAPSAVIATVPSAVATATQERPVEISAAASSARSASSGLTPRPERDPLLQEVALLSRATTAMNNGRIGEALSALDEHQRLFPNGVLSEERRAAKAQALCSSGRVADGRAQLARLSPNSPAGKRAKQVCDSSATPLTGVKTQ